MRRRIPCPWSLALIGLPLVRQFCHTRATCLQPSPPRQVDAVCPSKPHLLHRLLGRRTVERMLGPVSLGSVSRSLSIPITIAAAKPRARGVLPTKHRCHLCCAVDVPATRRPHEPTSGQRRQSARARDGNAQTLTLTLADGRCATTARTDWARLGNANQSPWRCRGPARGGESKARLRHTERKLIWVPQHSRRCGGEASSDAQRRYQREACGSLCMRQSAQSPFVSVAAFKGRWRPGRSRRGALPSKPEAPGRRRRKAGSETAARRSRRA